VRVRQSESEGQLAAPLSMLSSPLPMRNTPLHHLTLLRSPIASPKPICVFRGAWRNPDTGKPGLK